MADVEVIMSDDVVAWTFDHDQIVIPQHARPRSACFVPEQRCVVVVEAQSSDPSNAVVYDLTGSERLRLQPPAGTAQLGFDQVFVDSSGVVAVFAFRFRDEWGRPDLLTGVVPEWHEWR